MISRPTRSLFLIAFGHLVVELCSQFLPVLYPLMMETMGLNYTQVGIISLVHGIGVSLAQPLFGWLSDRWNPRWMVVLSLAWLGLLMGAVGLTSGYLSLLLVVALGVNFLLRYLQGRGEAT